VLQYSIKMAIGENEVDDDVQQECVELMRLLTEKNESNSSYINEI